MLWFCEQWFFFHSPPNQSFPHKDELNENHTISFPCVFINTESAYTVCKYFKILVFLLLFWVNQIKTKQTKNLFIFRVAPCPFHQFGCRFVAKWWPRFHSLDAFECWGSYFRHSLYRFFSVNRKPSFLFSISNRKMGKKKQNTISSPKLQVEQFGRQYTHVYIYWIIIIHHKSFTSISIIALKMVQFNACSPPI